MSEVPSAATPLRAANLRSILGNFGWLLGGRGVAAIVSLAYIAILTRTLGPADFGQFALIIGIGQTVTTFVGFQTWQVIVRFGMNHLHRNDPKAVVRLFKTCLMLDIAGAIVGALLAWGAVILLSPAFGWSPALANDALLFSIASLLAVRSTATGMMRLYDQFARAAFIDAVLPFTRLGGALLVWWTGPEVTGFLAAWATAEVVAAVFYWRGAYVTVRHLSWRDSGWATRTVAAENPGITKFALITNAGSTFDLAGKQVAVLLIGLYVTPAGAGGFRLTNQLGQALTKLSQFFARAMLPEIVRAKTIGIEPKRFTKLLRRSVMITSCSGGVIFLLLLFAGKPLLGLIAGPAFLSAYPLLLLLGSAAVIDLIGVTFEPVLMATGRAGQMFRVQLINAVVVIGLLLLLLPREGAIGAGIAVLAGSAVKFILFAILTVRALRASDPEVTTDDRRLIDSMEADSDRPEALG